MLLKAERPKSREYLEAVLDKAKQLLPGWQWALLHEAAFPTSGARASASKRRLAAQAAAQLAAGKKTPQDLDDDELQAVAEELVSMDMSDEALANEQKSRVTKSAIPDFVATCLERLLKGERWTQSTCIPMEVIAKHEDGIEVGLLDDARTHLVACTAPLASTLRVGDLVDVVDGEVLAKSERVLSYTRARADTYINEDMIADAMQKSVDFSGPEDAKVLFVTAAPNELEAARGEPLVGEDGRTFRDLYLAPLGLTKADVAVGFLVPHWVPDPVNEKQIAPWLFMAKQKMAAFKSARVIAVGKLAKTVLGDAATDYLPHPSAVRKSGNTEQLDRKIRRLTKTLTVPPEAGDIPLDDGNSPSEGWLRLHLTDAKGESGTGSAKTFVEKAAGEKQIVYGVVLDPNIVDAHNDWVPTGVIEAAAHDFVKKSRVIGFEHRARASASLVESFIEPYPTDGDYQAALQGRPHSVSRRMFGNQPITSGSWVIGVELNDELWSAFKSGDITGFSIGGFSAKHDADTMQMPDIKFIDLKPGA